MKMKNKKAEQIAAKKRHKEQLKASRKKAPGLERAAPSRTEKPTILIVCEGENTEPSYLRQFRLSTATIKPVGEGYNTVTLVRRAIALAQEDHYEQVWCVFDKDDFSANDFNSAITIADERAKRNHDRLDHRNPASEESSTTVFKLVEELLKYV